jgi:hypothetical protein
MNELRKQIRFINEILSALIRQSHSQYSEILSKTVKLQEKLQEVTTETRLIQKALDHRWLSAAGKCKIRLERALNDLPYLITNSKQFIARPVNKVPTFRDLMAEFTQLADEFGDVSFDMENQSISITTESIDLNDVYLGEFKIELRIDKLTESHRIAPYCVIALDPHPAATSSDVTHPHVSNDILCEGDGHTAICTALEQGRLCDFFNMVESILNTYNPDSPYVPLNEWEGRPCYDCGYICENENSYYCSSCDNDYCESCSSYCRMCDETVCLGCAGKCDCCEELICKHCAQQCSECDSYCCDQCLENGICKSCQEEREDNEEETETIESEKQLQNVGQEKSSVVTTI